MSLFKHHSNTAEPADLTPTPRPQAAPVASNHISLATDEVESRLSKKLAEIDTENLEKEAEIKAATFNLPYIDLRKIPITQEALLVMSEEQSIALQAVTFFILENAIRIATVNPQNPQLQAKVKELQDQRSADVKLYFVSQQSLDSALEKYSRLPKISDSIVGGIEISEEDIKKFQQSFTSFAELDKSVQKATLSDVVTIVLAGALKSDASDIHIEAEEAIVKIRFRIDGALHDAASLPIASWPKLISRIKLLAKLKINVATSPQDGRFTIFLDGQKIEVRVSTVPTTYGESVVMRILKSGVDIFDFTKLGLRGKSYTELQAQIKKPNGMVICTGPTGSGKTTTLYTVLNMVNDSEKKIITLEDPVEYKIEGINQSQIDTSNNYSFSDGLRSILRQDPDIIMVGEIRDLETAEVAINAALTGHLMLSTMHTNSAAGAVPRLLAMGVKPFLLAPAINAIEAQRLVRRLCQNCKKPIELDNTTMTLILNELNKITAESGYKPESLDHLQFYGPVGCEQCNNLGYKGRVGLFELLTMSAAVEKLILSGSVSEYDLEDIAIKSGMITMIQDGILKAMEGVTSIEEVLKKTE
jgi:type IV pilus assembly protein PilB